MALTDYKSNAVSVSHPDSHLIISFFHSACCGIRFRLMFAFALNNAPEWPNMECGFHSPYRDKATQFCRIVLM